MNNIIITTKINYYLEEDDSVSLLDYIIKNLTIDNQNIYIIIILEHNKEPKAKYNCENIGLEILNKESAKNLVENIIRYLKNVNIAFELKELFQLVGYDDKKIQ